MSAIVTFFRLAPSCIFVQNHSKLQIPPASKTPFELHAGLDDAIIVRKPNGLAAIFSWARWEKAFVRIERKPSCRLRSSPLQLQEIRRLPNAAEIVPSGKISHLPFFLCCCCFSFVVCAFEREESERGVYAFIMSSHASSSSSSSPPLRVMEKRKRRKVLNRKRFAPVQVSARSKISFPHTTATDSCFH